MKRYPALEQSRDRHSRKHVMFDIIHRRCVDTCFTVLLLVCYELMFNLIRGCQAAVFFGSNVQIVEASYSNWISFLKNILVI